MMSQSEQLILTRHHRRQTDAAFRLPCNKYDGLHPHDENGPPQVRFSLTCHGSGLTGDFR